jgi:hypothetical protein
MSSFMNKANFTDMKTQRLRIIAGWAVVVFLMTSAASGQGMYTYPLVSGFKGTPAAAPDLVVIPNNSGQAGHFTDRPIPASTCGTTGTAHGYFYEDDAGLQFDNPAGFIDQAYSIAFNLQVDQFVSPPAWVRILSFTHTDDVGIYIYLSNPPNTGTLEFWPYGTVGTDDFFTTTDFYQMILVRNDAGLIKVYVNGNLFAEYDDSGTRKYLPQSPGNYIIWFRDDPSVLAGEASPGFVSDIRIANSAWTPAQVQEVWSRFCSSLMGVDEPVTAGVKVHPNPVTGVLFLDIPAAAGTCSVAISDLAGRMVRGLAECNGPVSCDVGSLAPGLYVVRITGKDFRQNYRLVKK